jgi:uncharacterized protein (TIRG00374 family)
MASSVFVRTILIDAGRFALSPWALRALGLFIFGLILVRVDLGSVAETIANARPVLVVGALVLTVPFFIAKSYRWRVILHRYEIEISTGQALRIYCAGLFAGQATPGQLGEVVRARFLSTRGHDSVKSVASVVVDRALDLVALVLIAIPGFGLVFGAGAALALLSALLVMSIALVLMRPRRVLRAIAGKLGQRAQGVAGRVDELFESLDRLMRTPRDISVLVLTTMGALGINMLRFYLLLASLGLSLPIVDFVFGVALANLLALLPVTIFGVGTRDAVLALVFLQAGGTTEGAVAFSLLILAVAYLLNMVVGSIAWALETGRTK